MKNNLNINYTSPLEQITRNGLTLRVPFVETIQLLPSLENIFLNPFKAVTNVIAGVVTIAALLPAQTIFSAAKSIINFGENLIHLRSNTISSLIKDLGSTAVTPINYALKGLHKIGLGLTQAAVTLALPITLPFYALNGRVWEIDKSLYEKPSNRFGNLGLEFQLLGGMQPLLDITKELQDSGTRYKSIKGHFLRDILSPFRAVGNVLAGTLTIAAIAPLTVVAAINTVVRFGEGIINGAIVSPIRKFQRNPSMITNKPARFIVNYLREAIISPITNLFNDTAYTLINPVAYACDGVGRMGLGIVQAAKTLALPIIIPFRALHTAARGMPTVNEDNGMRDACKVAKGVGSFDVSSPLVMASELRFCHKIDKAKAQGRTLNLKKDDNLKKYTDVVKSYMEDKTSISFSRYHYLWYMGNNDELEANQSLANIADCIASPAA